jgi:hypothetical protein
LLHHHDAKPLTIEMSVGNDDGADSSAPLTGDQSQQQEPGWDSIVTMEMRDYQKGRTNSSATVQAVEPDFGSSQNSQSWAEYRPSIQPLDKNFDAHYNLSNRCIRSPAKTSVQAKVYNFLERPTGWKCFIYHFTV